ncbi:hypothetical protein NUW54_g11233 [Trametes sanguinea]|uniref:Uncharacterized protein n=1 Tax=Trametes sanguinea TaxID=158606 RepID=A0ACC1NIS7_9APHY|nr:hypothetical protein NUW54_g11233 [Trametes sanguinea]
MHGPSYDPALLPPSPDPSPMSTAALHHLPQDLVHSWADWRHTKNNAPLTPPQSTVPQRRVVAPQPQSQTVLPPISYFDRSISRQSPGTSYNQHSHTLVPSDIMRAPASHRRLPVVVLADTDLAVMMAIVVHPRVAGHLRLRGTRTVVTAALPPVRALLPLAALETVFLPQGDVRRATSAAGPATVVVRGATLLPRVALVLGRSHLALALEPPRLAPGPGPAPTIPPLATLVAASPRSPSPRRRSYSRDDIRDSRSRSPRD